MMLLYTLTKVMVNISNWLNNCHLQLNSSKMVAMFFQKQITHTQNLMVLYLDRDTVPK